MLVVGDFLPSADLERVLRDYSVGKLGDADLEERPLKIMDEGQFQALCQTALERLASNRFNLDMLIARAASECRNAASSLPSHDS